MIRSVNGISMGWKKNRREESNKENGDMNNEKYHVSHPNTALLVDCCVERGLYLIFRFSTFTPRCKTLVGVAKGLRYLHKRCNHRIIHRDIIRFSSQFLNVWLSSIRVLKRTLDEKTDIYAFAILLLKS
ncbi:hypothetical protein HID58_046063 [Brassica napus]|uniref:Protein kinase domain-containing protein n=1 Tax=Brassica napus TaxID=3708 RepID=A0ABQ8AVC2_BRANA|nr:hypothetical protein HID58_046063 [Brassica napus]